MKDYTSEVKSRFTPRRCKFLGCEPLDEGADQEFRDEGHAEDGFPWLLGSLNSHSRPDFCIHFGASFIFPVIKLNAAPTPI